MLWHVVAFFSLNFGCAQLCDPDAGLNLSLEVCGASNASTFWFENSWNPWNEKDHFGSSSACQRNATKLVAMPRPAKLRRRTPLDGMSDEGAAAFNQFKEDAWVRILYVCAILIHTIGNPMLANILGSMPYIIIITFLFLSPLCAIYLQQLVWLFTSHCHCGAALLAAKDLKNSTDLKSRVVGIGSLVVWCGDKGDTTCQETIVANKELVGIFTRCLKMSKCLKQIKPLAYVVKLVMTEWQVASLWFETCPSCFG